MKISFSKKMAVLIIGTLSAFSACKNSPYPGYEMAENGLYFKFYKQDEAGAKPKEGDIVRFIMSYKNGKDSVLFDSKNTQITHSDKNYIEFPLQKSTFKGSFEDAISMMSVGDSASFIINADSVYLKTFQAKELPPYIEKGSMLTFEAKLEKITSKSEVETERNKKMEEQKVMSEMQKSQEPKALAKYIEDNKIAVKPTASGLYFIEKTKGKGPKPTLGDTVKVNYTGRLIDGTVFDTNDEAAAKKSGTYDARRQYQPVEFALGQVIPGWNEALALMSPGSKVQLIIPSSIGYGEQSMGPIPAYATLVFDVELISFKKGKH